MLKYGDEKSKSKDVCRSRGILTSTATRSAVSCACYIGFGRDQLLRTAVRTARDPGFIRGTAFFLGFSTSVSSQHLQHPR